MNNNKYYRVRKKQTRFSTDYIVEGTTSIFNILINNWIEYEYKNVSLDEAINHIKMLSDMKIKVNKIVYKTKAK